LYLYLLRHGQSRANAGLETGPDTELTALGRLQAEEVGTWLAARPVHAVLVSPYRRCLRTAAAAVRGGPLRAEVCPLLHEHHHEPPVGGGTSPLMDRRQLRDAFPRFDVPEGYDPLPLTARGESDEQLRSRAERVVHAVLARFAASERHVAVVSHAALLKEAVHVLMGWPRNDLRQLVLDPGCLAVVRIAGEVRRLVCLNVHPATTGR
jgi:broad specificity phosphatase PhoE